MNASRKLSTLLTLVVAGAMLWHLSATADSASRYQPNRMLRASEALEQNKPDRVLALLHGWVDKQPNRVRRADGHALLCRAYFARRDFVLAQQSCDAAVTAVGKDHNWSHLNNRGVMRLMLGQFDAALQDFAQAAELKPRSRAVHTNIAVAERERKVAQPQPGAAAQPS